VSSQVNLTGGSTLRTGILWLGHGGAGTIDMTNSTLLVPNYARMGSFANGAGTLKMNASTATIGFSFHLGEVADSTGNVELTNGSTLDIGSRLYVGNLGSGTMTVTDSTLNINTQSVSNSFVGLDGRSGGTNELTLDNSTLTMGVAGATTGRFHVGNRSTGVMNVTNGSTVYLPENLYAGVYDAETSGSLRPRGNGTVNVTGDGSSVTVRNVTRLGDSGTGAMTVSDGGQFTSPTIQVGIFAPAIGTLNVTGSGSRVTATTIVAGERGTGTINVSAGGQLTGNLYQIGYDYSTATGTGTLNVTDGGLVTATDLYAGVWGGATGTINVTGSGSSVTATTVRSGDSGTGTISVGSGGQITTTYFEVGRYATGRGTANLNDGGLITTNSVALGAGSTSDTASIFNFHGGTLRARSNNINFITDGNTTTPSHVYVKSGGAIIDTNGFNVVAKIAFEADAVSTGGGLTKNGDGQLILASGMNDFTGEIAVNAGTLVAYTDSLEGTPFGATTVEAGASLTSAEWDSVNDVINIEVPATLKTTSLTLADGSNIGTVLCGVGDVNSATSIETTTLAAAGGGSATVGVTFTGATPVTASGPHTILAYTSKTGTLTYLPEYDSIGTLAANIVDTGSAVQVSFADLDYWTGGGLNENYSNAANWSSTVPNATNRRALFTGTGQTVDLDVNVTVSSLIFGAGGFDLSPVGGTSLTLDSSIAQKTQITNIVGSNTVGAPIVLNKDTRITVAEVDDTLTLSGVVTGAGNIEKAGDGTLAMANLGSGPAGDLVLGGGTFRYIGTTATSARGLAFDAATTFDVEAADATLTLNGNLSGAGGALTKTGDGTIEVRSPSASTASVSSLTILGGGLAIDGLSGTTQLNVTGGLSMATSAEGEMPTSGSLTLSGDAVLNVSGYSAFGTYGGTASLTMNDNAVYKGTSGRIGGMYQNTLTSDYNTVDIEMNGNAAIEYTSFFNIGEQYSNVTMTMNDASSVTANSADFGWGNECTSTGVLNGTSSITTNSSFNIAVNGTNSTGSVTLNNSSSVTCNSGWLTVGSNGAGTEGFLNLNDSASVTAVDAIAVGNNNGANGTVTMTGDSTMTCTGGIFIGNSFNGGGTGEAFVSGNAVMRAIDHLEVAWGGTGIVNIGNGDPAGNARVTSETTATYLGYGTYANSAAVATNARININTGGTFECVQIINGKDTDGVLTSSVLNFNGGTLKALASSADFMTNDAAAATFGITVQEEGARIDTNGFDIAINADLIEDAGSTGGGLTKLGEGTLTLGGANNYTGDTRVEGGTLKVIAALLNDSADVWISTGAKLDLDFLAIDTIDALFLGGVAKAIGTYGSTASGATYQFDDYFSGTGVLSVTSYVPNIQIPGDADGDLKVDAVDAKRLAENWGATSLNPGYTTMWEMGDFNGDGKIDAKDASILAAQWGDYTTPAESQGTAVPEPGMFALLLGLALAGLARRVRR
ncbi:MAG: hypothetical protein GX621_01770, partial [Pirellulaceae bacterium]|nr:hypothetical protein [Pirellulaceae bacterium]